MEGESVRMRTARLSRVRNTYNKISRSIVRGYKPPEAKRENVPELYPLNVNSNVGAMINYIKSSAVITSPRNTHNEFKAEINASSARVKQVRNGMSIFKAMQSTPRKIEIQPNDRVLIHDEPILYKQPKGYVVPQTELPPDLVLPTEVVSESGSALSLNELNTTIYKANEAERNLYNEYRAELNRMERRRESYIRTRYKDYLEFGLDESRRRADRAAKLAALEEKSERKNDPWWPTFVQMFRPESKSLYDIECLTKLASLPKIDAANIGKMYSKSKQRARAEYRDIIRAANEAGNLIESLRLNMVFKNVDDGTFNEESA